MQTHASGSASDGRVAVEPVRDRGAARAPARAARGANAPSSREPIERRCAHRFSRPPRHHSHSPHVEKYVSLTTRSPADQPVDALPHLAHDAGHLVAHRHRRLRRELVVPDVQVGAADARRRRPRARRGPARTTGSGRSISATLPAPGAVFATPSTSARRRRPSGPRARSRRSPRRARRPRGRRGTSGSPRVVGHPARLDRAVDGAVELLERVGEALGVAARVVARRARARASAARSAGRGGRARAARAPRRPTPARRSVPSASNQMRFLRPALTCETTSEPRAAVVEAQQDVREVLGRHLALDALDVVAAAARTSRPGRSARAAPRAPSRGRRTRSRPACRSRSRRGRASASRCRRPRAARRPARGRAASSSRCPSSSQSWM